MSKDFAKLEALLNVSKPNEHAPQLDPGTAAGDGRLKLVKELGLFGRRQLMATASLAASTAAAASFGIAHASPLRSTPGQILGPFGPTQAKPDVSGDLTRVPGTTGRAMGQ